MTDPYIDHEHSGDADIGRLVRRAYWTPVDLETAARHLWRLHRVAAAPVPVRGARRTLVSALAAVLLFATAGGAVALSTSAVPGDPLYSVKRGAERVHLLVSFAPESDARLHLRFARSRIGEAQTVAHTRPEIVPDLLSEVVASVDHATTVGGTGLAEEVEIVRMEASTALSSLADLEGELAESVDHAIRALVGEATAVTAAPGPAGEGVPPHGGDADAGDGTEGAPDAPDGTPEEAPAAPGTATARHPVPDRTAPPPSVTPSGPIADPDAFGEGDGRTGGGDVTGAAEEDAGKDVEDGGVAAREPPAGTAPAPGQGGDGDHGSAQPPSPSPGTAAPEPTEIAADSTMPTLERLEGLLQQP